MSNMTKTNPSEGVSNQSSETNNNSNQKGIINDNFTEWKVSRTDLFRVSIDRLYEIEDKLLILRDDSFGQLREEYEEILFDVRMIRKQRS